MALNFPDSPTDGQKHTDSTAGETWTYEASTNSWTSDGLTTSAGIVYKGGIDITTAAPSGVKSGWMYSVTTGGAPHASFTGLPNPTNSGSTVMWDGSKWEALSSFSMPSASETAVGLVELATAAETTTGTDNTRAVHPQGLKVELDKKVNKAGDTMTGDLTAPNLIATGNVQTTSVNGGQLAGFRNIIINGAVTINQRGVTYAAAAVGNYWADRWKKTAGGMTQIIEEGSFTPGATYTLSGTGVTTAQLTAPGTGHWTLPDIPSTATNIQLELGTVATPFERRPIGTELALCQRYYEVFTAGTSAASFILTGQAISAVAVVCSFKFAVTKRAVPSFSQTGTWSASQASGASAGGTTSLNGASIYHAKLLVNGAAGLVAGHASLFFCQTTDGRLEFDAEL